MSVLDDLYIKYVWNEHTPDDTEQPFKAEVKEMMLALIGDMEQRETEDMQLKSWTNEDYKAFGRNDLRSKLISKVVAL